MEVDKRIKNKLKSKIGETVRYFRRKNNISQEELAFNIGVDRTYVSAIEKGNKCPSLYCLYNIAKELNLKLKDLLDINL